LNDWARTHLSVELQEYLTDTTMRGIFATSGDSASRVDFLAIITLFAGASLLGFRAGWPRFRSGLRRGSSALSTPTYTRSRKDPMG
ncbi:MAG TPA: hypothetical protein VGA66_05080, partial [Mycobacterium sp.]